jgi:hypothetical protein
VVLGFPKWTSSPGVVSLTHRPCARVVAGVPVEAMLLPSPYGWKNPVFSLLVIVTDFPRSPQRRGAEP